MQLPLIGITVDNVESNFASGKYESNVEYSRMVAAAGGLPLLLPQEIELASHYVELCDGLMFTGGDDVRTEAFGIPAHPESHCIDPRRQAFELALLDALANKPERPALGVCYGMQLMAVHAGGRMNQHLPETLANAVEEHQNNHRHPIVIRIGTSAMLTSPGAGARLSNDELSNTAVVSSHHQAVVDAGRLRVIADSPDGVIEAIDDPTRPFYVGVQWHPERSDGLLNLDLIKRFIAACARDSSADLH
ncbi:MAG: gamma-glutamyl-gamma-aminobutyrate hydrolase [Planctomycetaceae bacterium]|nr:gamma-glutamyl-gamma-aminobutyrate hydrolase [Planctomycetaceae bacterium]